MDTENPPGRDEEEVPERDREWKVQGEESMDRLVEQEALRADGSEGGMMIFTDEHGRRRRIPAERGAMSSRELRSAAKALHADLGAAPADYARIAAIERLTELHAAGKFSDEDFEREKKRLENT